MRDFGWNFQRMLSAGGQEKQQQQRQRHKINKKIKKKVKRNEVLLLDSCVDVCILIW